MPVPDLCWRLSAFQPRHREQLLSRPVQHFYKLYELCCDIDEPCLTDKPRSKYRVVQGPLTHKHWLSTLPTTQIHVWLEFLWQPVSDLWWRLDSLLSSHAWRTRCTFCQQMGLCSIKILFCTMSEKRQTEAEFDRAIKGNQLIFCSVCVQKLLLLSNNVKSIWYSQCYTSDFGFNVFLLSFLSHSYLW